MISTKVEITAETIRTVAKLKGSDAMPDLRRQMRAATSAMQPAVRAAVRATPSAKKRDRDSLRSAVASSVQRKIKLSTKKVLVVITCVPRGGKSNLARVLEGDIIWRHPVYGHLPEIYQTPHPFFWQTVENLIPETNSQIESVLENFERKL